MVSGGVMIVLDSELAKVVAGVHGTLSIIRTEDCLLLHLLFQADCQAHYIWLLRKQRLPLSIQSIYRSGQA